MKYHPREYAAALVAALEKKSLAEQKEITRNFVKLLHKYGDGAKVASVSREFERRYLAAAGLKKALIESADPTGGKLKNEIEKILGGNILFREIINPRLIAGIKILINDEVLVDASAQTQIKRML